MLDLAAQMALLSRLDQLVSEAEQRVTDQRLQADRLRATCLSTRRAETFLRSQGDMLQIWRHGQAEVLRAIALIEVSGDP